MNKFSQLREKAKTTSAHNKTYIITGLSTAVGAAIIMSGVLSPPLAQAQSYSAAINHLNQENASVQSARQDLLQQNTNLSTTIANQEQQIDALQKHIRQNQVKSKQLKHEIALIKAEIDQQRTILGKDIRQMYFDQQMTLLEKLAVSDTMSDFVDKEAYHIATADKIKTGLDRINALKKQDEAMQRTIDKLLTDQNAMKQQIAKQQADNAHLLSLNQSQVAAYNQQVSVNNVHLAELRQKQAQLNTQGFIGSIKTAFPSTASASTASANASSSAPSAGHSNGGGVKYVDGRLYPYANAPWPNEIADPWGMYERQCVSYTAWKVDASGRYMPYWGGHGNAKNWPSNAQSAGISVNHSPHVGDVAISTAGTYGHAMYVEKVYDDGTVYVSQYNASWDGRYSEGHRSSSGLYFIHF